MTVKKVLCLVVSALAVSSLVAQPSFRDSTALFTPGVSYSFSIPENDFHTRFGDFSKIGLDLEYKTKGNFIAGLEWSFMFGNKVKEDVLFGVKNRIGQVINSSGNYADILLFQRGMTFVAVGGKIFPVIGPNVNSGIVVKGGVGYMYHKVRIETQNDDVPQLQGEYLKGYDRLTGGLLSYQFIGYQHFSNNNLVNFFIGLEFGQGFTKSQRDFNFFPGLKDDKKRQDFFYGLKLSWIIPIYKKAPKQFYTH